MYSVQYQKKVVLELTAYNSVGPTNVENRPEQTVNGGGSDLRWENGTLKFRSPQVPGTSSDVCFFAELM